MIESPNPHPAAFRRRDWIIVLTLAAVQFTHMVDFVIIMPLGDGMMSEFRIQPNQFSYIVGVYGISAAVASLLASLVSDRFDRKLMLAGSYAGFLVATALCGLANNYPLMLASRALAGAFGGVAAGAIMAIIGDAFRPEQRGKATGVVMSAFSVASVAGLPVGLYLAGAFGRGVPFLTLAGISVGVLALILAYLPSFRAHLLYQRRDVFSEFASAVREPRHLTAFLFTTLVVMGAFTVASFLGPYYLASNKGRGWTEHRELAIIYFVAGLATFASMSVIGRLSDRFGKRQLFTVMVSVSLLMCLVVTNVVPTTLWLATTLLTLFMVAAVGRMVPAQAMLIGVPLARNRGAFTSLNSATQNAATGLAPVIAGLMMTQHADGTLSGYPLVGLFGAAAALASIGVARFLKPVEPAAAVVATPPAEVAEREAVAV